MNPGCFFLICNFLFLSALCNGQIIERFKFRKVESEVNVSNENINAIIQDSKGFMWVGTEDGLNRFDGYEFKIYRNVPGDSTSLLKNYIQSILEDSRGTIWVSSTSSGLHRYNRDLDNFSRVNEFSKAGCQVMDIKEGADQTIWIGGLRNNNSFVAQYNYKTDSWKEFLLFPSNDAVFTIEQQSADAFWLGTRQNGLFLWNHKTNSLQQFKNDPINKNSLPDNNIQKIIKDSQGFLWVGTRNGLGRFDPEKKIFKNFTVASTSQKGKTGLPVNVILDICMDGEYQWIATENGGLSRMNRVDETFINFKYDKDDPNSIVSNSIWSLYKDRQNRIWAGSYAKGLCVFDKILANFSEVNIPAENDIINSVIQDSKGRLWLATEVGVFMQENNAITHYKHDPGNSSSLSSNAALCIFEDRKHQIWIGNWDGGINRYNENTKGFKHYPPGSYGPQELYNQNVFSIVESSETGEILVCTFDGLFILKDQEKGIFENITSKLHPGSQLLTCAIEDRNKNLWVGSYSGLSRIDLKTKTYKEYNLANHSPDLNDRIYDILEDHKGRLWIASHVGLHLKIDSINFVNYSTEDGLPVNVVKGLAEDEKGNLWLGTTHGLVEFNPETKVFKTYDESDGLHSSDFRGAFFRDRDGRIFAGGKGLNVFYPDSLKHNENVPPVYITDFKVFNLSLKPDPENDILKHSITETSRIKLSYKESFFSIHYVGLNYTSTNKNQYAYKLDGFDKDWNYVGDLRFATYTNLNPGTYTFHVKASNNDDLWNESGATLTVVITPAWWETLFFRSAILVAVTLMVGSIYYWRVKSVHKQNIELERMVNVRTGQLKEINNQLEISELEIKKQNEELVFQRAELAVQNKELTQGQEEASAQRDLMAQQNKELEGARKIIELKKNEMELHNQTLELEVARRTQELLTHNNQLEQFAFISAHNLRSPVARILGLGEILRLSGNTEEEEKLIVRKIVFTTQELDHVVKDLNQILDIRKKTSTITEINLKNEVRLIKANLQKEIEDTNAIISEDFTSVEEIVSVKPYIDSILMNLVSNAIKYRHPDRVPSIKIWSEKGDEEICIHVSDNGLGIDLSTHSDKLFKLYNRFHFHVEGKGLGLYMTKTQVVALGGTISASSEPQVGTAFKITLPMKS